MNKGHGVHYLSDLFASSNVMSSPHIAKLQSVGIENLHKTLTLRGGFCSEWVKNLKKTHSLVFIFIFFNIKQLTGSKIDVIFFKEPR